MEMNHAEVQDVFGFDLGDGESSVTKCPAAGRSEPEALRLIDGRTSFLTCVGRDSAGQILLGQRALDEERNGQAHLTFKRAHGLADSHSRELAGDFFAAVLERAKAMGGEPGKSLVVVGHPSAWSEEDVKGYVSSLSSRSGWSVQGISESRAAFLQLKEMDLLPIARLRASALIVDVGSSTTDFTLINDLSQQPVEFGHNDLGGRLIDRTILHQLLAENGLNGRVKTILESNKRIYSQCEYACRMLKESFFSNEEQYRRSNGKVKAAIVEIDDENLLRPQATPALIDAALAEPQASLDGRGWKEAFLVTLQDVRRECEKFGKPPETIALTGGGARMKFVKEACECVFPDALVLIDATPELSIAKGLARAGRWDIRATRFRDEIEPLCERIPGAFKQEGPQFLSEVVPRLSDSFVSDVMRAGLKDWRAGRVKTLNGIEKHIAELGDRWARSDSVKQIVANATANWTKRAVAQLWPSVTEVAMKYEISAESLSVSAKSDKAIAVSVKGPNLDQDTSPFAWIAGAVAGAISAKIAVVVVPVVMAVLLKATIITAAMTGPVGWAIAGVIVLAGTFFGKEAAQDMVKDMDIYVWIREKLLSDAKLDAACIKAKDEVEEKLRSELEVALKATLVAKASAELKRDLTERMENAIVLIR